jgi:hypothetical protein
MKHQVRLAAEAILGAALLLACSPQSAAPPSAPTEQAATEAPATEPAPTVAPTPTVALEPAVATVTFEGRSCTYDGPSALPAAEELAIDWKMLTQDAEDYYLRPFTGGQDMSADEALAMLPPQDPANAKRVVLPAELVPAGSFQAYANAPRTSRVTVKAASGPLQGSLYFSCWDSDKAFQVLGPFELK